MREKHEERHGLYVDFLFFVHCRKTSGASLWGPTVEKSPPDCGQQGARSMLSAAFPQNWRGLRPAVWPSLASYRVLLARELPLPSDCWSELVSLSQGSRQLSFLNLMKSKKAMVYLTNTTSKQSAGSFFHPLEIQLPAHPGATFGWLSRNGNGRGFRTQMPLFLASSVINYSFDPPHPPRPSLVAPWILPGWLSQSDFMWKSTSSLTGVLHNPSGCSRYETATALPGWSPDNHPLHCSAQAGL